jgi:type II secretory pathway pseudopilin PulG
VSLLVAILIVALLGVVVLVVSAPLRAAGRSQDAQDATVVSSRQQDRLRRDAALDRDELVAARAAKYREIRDAELDFRTGKLSREDYAAIDGELRTEAVEILDRLEQLDGRAQPGGPTDTDGAHDRR